MSATAPALPTTHAWASRTRRRAGDALAFTQPGSPLVAVCGLHGGAGTTTLACLLAEHAASASLAGRVIAVEADPRAGELARRLHAASELSLGQLARVRTDSDEPAPPAVAQRGDGLRVLAASRADPSQAPATALAGALAEARAMHALCVVDAGCIRQPAAEPALAGADVVVWAADPWRLADDAFASPLLRPARGAHWVLALVPVSGRARRRVPRRLRSDLAAVVVLPGLSALEAGAALAAAERLARAVRG